MIVWQRYRIVVCHLADKSHCWPSGPVQVSTALKNSMHKCIKDSESYTRLTNLHKSHTMPVAVIQYDGLNYRGRTTLKCWSVLDAVQGPVELMGLDCVPPTDTVSFAIFFVSLFNSFCLKRLRVSKDYYLLPNVQKEILF